MSQHRLLSGADTDIIHPRFVINIFTRPREVAWEVVFVSGAVICSSFDKALLNKEVVLDDTQLLDIRRCKELVPI